MKNSPSGANLSELDQILGPVLANSNGSPESRARALLVKGLSKSVPSEEIRLWIQSRCVAGFILGSASDAIGMQQEPNARNGRRRSRGQWDIAHAMRSLTEAEGWGQLVGSARERVLSSSGASRDSLAASFDIARRVVAGVMRDFPGEPVLLKRNVGARAALMVMGLKMLSEDDVWDTVIASHPWVAAELGTDPRAPASWLALLEDRGIVTRPRARAFVPSRYHVKALSKQRLAAAREWDGVVRGLVDGEAGPIATVLRSVAHPAWTYSDKMGLTHWAMLLADTAQVPHEVFGIRPRMAAKLRSQLTAEFALGPGVVVPYLKAILDRLADDVEYGTTDKSTGERITAREAKSRAMIAWREKADANKEAAAVATEQKKAAYAELADLLALHPIPRSPFGGKDSTREAREGAVLAWVDALHGLVLSGNPTQVWRKAVGTLLVKRLVQMDYTLASADGAVSYIMHAAAGTSLDEWLELDDDLLASVISGHTPMERALAQSRASANSAPSRRRE